MSVLRVATPSQLLICLILFFLPWIEIQCPVPDLKGIADPASEKQANSKPVGWSPLFSQSGLQAATGDYTVLDATMRGIMEMAKENAKASGAKSEDEPKPAPLLFLIPIAAVAGIVGGFALPQGKPRKVILILCCWAVLASVSGQVLMGFPIAKSVKEQSKKEQDKDKSGANRLDVGGGESFEPKVTYKAPFFLVFIFALGGIATAAIESSRPPRNMRNLPTTHDENPEALAFGELESDVQTPEKPPKNSPFESLG